MENARSKVVIAAALVAVMGCKKEQVEVQEPIQPEVEKFPVIDVDSFDYVCIEMVGSYDKHGEAIAKLQQAIKEQGIEPTGPMFGIYYNSPDDASQDMLEWEIGYPASLDAEPSAPLVAKRWDYTEVVSTVYKGPYQSTSKTYSKMFAFIGTLDDREPAGPTLERFLDEDPDMVEPDDLQTEIWIPIEQPEPEPQPEADTAADGGKGEASKGDDVAEEPDEEPTDQPAEEPAEKPAKGKKGK